jgi:acetyl-CoA/propionyl-CoA carboxylase carboxyl transferase subunit
MTSATEPAVIATGLGTPPAAVSLTATGEPADLRNPEIRLRSLFDAGSLRLLHERDKSGVLAGRGRLDGMPAVAFATDPAVMGGAIGAAGCVRMTQAIDTALEERVPVLGLWHSGGARLGEGVSALHGIGGVFDAIVRASGRVPQISVVLGPCAGGAAYGPALTDLVIMSAAGRVFVTGPDVVRKVTGEQLTMEELGGPEPHTQRSGVVHAATPDEASALACARSLAVLMGRQVQAPPPRAADDDPARVLPENPARAYDVKPLITLLLDEPGVELHAQWARNMVTTLGRLAGRTVGVVANNPLRKGGCLDSASAEKAARFVRMCDSFGIPLVVIVDVPGYLPGGRQEWEGVVRRGAKLLHAFAEAEVPRVTLVTRKAYGGAYIAMNSRSLGATAVFAWPQAEIAVMGAGAAVEILYRRQLAAAAPEQRGALLAELTAEQSRRAGSVSHALAIGVVDSVVEPAQTRSRIAEVLDRAAATRGTHRNIPL